MEKITSLFGGHKKEGDETHGEAKAHTTVESSGGQGQAVRTEEGEKKGGLFGFGGHKVRQVLLCILIFVDVSGMLDRCET